jgi:hypothetical protein
LFPKPINGGWRGHSPTQFNFAVKSFAEESVMYRDRFVEFAALALLAVLIAAMYAGLLF